MRKSLLSLLSVPRVQGPQSSAPLAAISSDHVDAQKLDHLCLPVSSPRSPRALPWLWRTALVLSGAENAITQRHLQSAALGALSISLASGGKQGRPETLWAPRHGSSTSASGFVLCPFVQLRNQPQILQKSLTSPSKCPAESLHFPGKAESWRLRGE